MESSDGQWASTVNFDLTEEQKQFRGRIDDFAAKFLDEDAQQRDRDAEFSESLWECCADFGLLKMNVPVQYGGDREPIDLFDAVLAMEALGKGCRDQGLLLAINVQLWSVQLPILQVGSEYQKRELLPKLASGQWKAAHAMTEPEVGSDAFGITTSATPVEGGYRLTGKKCMVTLAPLADLMLVTAVVDRSKGRWGLGSFLVEPKSIGCEVGPVDSKMGMRTVPFSAVELKDCFVPDVMRLGTKDGDMTSLQTLLEVERCCILAGHVGAMEYQLEQAVQFARSRRQFSTSIGSFQSVSNRIADMRVRLETSRLLLYRVAWLKSQNRSAVSEAAMLKLHLSESFVTSSMDAMRIHGGRGYMTEFGVEKDLRDAMGGLFYAGTSDIQRNIVARMMGVG